MPDITMCENNDCPLNNKCFRYLAKPDRYQAYSCFLYNDGCEYFWDIS